MKYIKNILLSAVLILSLISFLVNYLPVESTTADAATYQVDIATQPANGFLQAYNMAPGDKVTSIIKVQNNGNLDFNYTVKSNQEIGSTELYNLLQLVISDSKGKLYEGYLSELNDLPIGTIAKTDEQVITFTAMLPIEAGNDYQGKDTKAAFVFNATGHNVPLDDCFEPPFSNNQFTLHQKSTVPIKFHLHDQSGKIDEVERQGVRLEVIGPSADGGIVTYVFAIHNGTLKFDNKLSEPHYLARFSTFDYPVVTGGTYIAKVYNGDTLYCSKEFMVLKNGNRSNAP